jgi:CRP-like cAMP-binding protein
MEAKLFSFFDKYPEILYNRGEKILRPNEYYDQVYFLKKGLVRFFKVLKSGQEISFSSYDPVKQKNIIFGNTHLLKDYHVEAFTDVALQRAPKSLFQEFINNNPYSKDQIIRDYQIIFEEVLRQIEWLSVPDAYTRIKLVLYSLGQKIGFAEKNKSGHERTTKIELKITHHIIASFAGLSRESVSIQVNKLVTEEYLSRKNNAIVINNLEELVKNII